MVTWKNDDDSRKMEVSQDGQQTTITFSDANGSQRKVYSIPGEAQRDYDDFKAGKLDVLTVSARVGFES